MKRMHTPLSYRVDEEPAADPSKQAPGPVQLRVALNRCMDKVRHEDPGFGGVADEPVAHHVPQSAPSRAALPQVPKTRWEVIDEEDEDEAPSMLSSTTAAVAAAAAAAVAVLGARPGKMKSQVTMGTQTGSDGTPYVPPPDGMLKVAFTSVGASPQLMEAQRTLTPQTRPWASPLPSPAPPSDPLQTSTVSLNLVPTMPRFNSPVPARSARATSPTPLLWYQASAPSPNRALPPGHLVPPTKLASQEFQAWPSSPAGWSSTSPRILGPSGNSGPLESAQSLAAPKSARMSGSMSAQQLRPSFSPRPALTPIVPDLSSSWAMGSTSSSSSTYKLRRASPVIPPREVTPMQCLTPSTSLPTTPSGTVPWEIRDEIIQQCFQQARLSASQVPNAKAKWAKDLVAEAAVRAAAEALVRTSAKVIPVPVETAAIPVPVETVELKSTSRFAEAALELRKRMGPGLVVCVLGSTTLLGGKCEQIVRGMAEELSNVYGGTIHFVTSGLTGVQQVFAESCGSKSKLWNLVTTGQRCAFEVGETLEAGTSADERRETSAYLSDMYIVFEGGPEEALEVRTAHARGARIVPIIRTGGASAGGFGFPLSALERPAGITEETWAHLASKEATIAETVNAACVVVKRLLQAAQATNSFSPPLIPAAKVPTNHEATTLRLAGSLSPKDDLAALARSLAKPVESVACASLVALAAMGAPRELRTRAASPTVTATPPTAQPPTLMTDRSRAYQEHVPWKAGSVGPALVQQQTQLLTTLRSTSVQHCTWPSSGEAVQSLSEVGALTTTIAPLQVAGTLDSPSLDSGAFPTSRVIHSTTRLVSPRVTLPATTPSSSVAFGSRTTVTGGSWEAPPPPLTSRVVAPAWSPSVESTARTTVNPPAWQSSPSSGHSSVVYSTLAQPVTSTYYSSQVQMPSRVLSAPTGTAITGLTTRASSPWPTALSALPHTTVTVSGTTRSPPMQSYSASAPSWAPASQAARVDKPFYGGSPTPAARTLQGAAMLGSAPR